MKKKFFCRIYRCLPFVDCRYRFEEFLVDSRFASDSDYQDFTLSEVHSHFVRLVERSTDFVSGRYRVTTSSARSSTVESSYIIK